MSNIPWIEKYRPRVIEELVVQESTLKRIKRIIEDDDMPNIIITGIPGIGKTSTILCIAKQLLGKYYNQGVLELNASDDRGIKAVQESMIYFCKKKMETADGQKKNKIILLDEADNMTKKAQQLINTLMETYENTRFAFTCNNSSDIIESIQSRCIIFRYVRLSPEGLTGRLKYICKQEQVNYTESGLRAIVLTANGDMRKAINNLQLVHTGYSTVNGKNVYNLCDTPDPILIKDIFVSCHKKDLISALVHLDKLLKMGFCASDISMGMICTLKFSELKEINDVKKMAYLKMISDTCIIISRGINTDLQLSGCISRLCLL